MTAHLIAYDLNRETIRPPIVAKIKSLGTSWAKLSESSYAVADAGTVQQVFQALKPLLDPNDNLYVSTLKKPWTGFGPPAVNQWMEQHLSS